VEQAGNPLLLITFNLDKKYNQNDDIVPTSIPACNKNSKGTLLP